MGDPDRHDPWDTGRQGEALAWAFLERRGWRLLGRNVRLGPLEIDLVIERDGTVAFVEVKTRRTTTPGGALEAIGPRKRADLVRAARTWARTRGQPGWGYRFDAVAVTWGTDGSTRIEHVEDAWRA